MFEGGGEELLPGDLVLPWICPFVSYDNHMYVFYLCLSVKYFLYRHTPILASILLCIVLLQTTVELFSLLVGVALIVHILIDGRV